MPELGSRKKEKVVKGKKADPKEVVSAYSEEGEKRNAPLRKGFGLRFRILLIAFYVLLFVGAIVLIVVGEQQGWL
jgi:hypothetical protein